MSLRIFSACFSMIVVAAIGAASPALADSDYDKLSNIHAVAVVSILGNDIDMQTQGATRFDYADYKMHTDWNLDLLLKDYVTKAISSRFTVTNDAVDPQLFSGLDRDQTLGVSWTDIKRKLRSNLQKPSVDAVIVIYPENFSDTGYLSAGLAATYNLPILWHDGSTAIAAIYTVAIFDAKTGDRIDYGTGRYPQSGFISGYSPPWENCAKEIWADTEDKLTVDQKARIRTEMWSLLTRSMPYALLNSGLIDKSAATALAASAALGDPSCHRLP